MLSGTMIGVMPAASAPRTPGSESSSTTQSAAATPSLRRGEHEDVGRGLAARDLVAADERVEALRERGALELRLRARAARRRRDALGHAHPVEPVEQRDEPRLQRDALARDDRVVRDVPRLHQRVDRIVGAVVRDDQRAAIARSCGRSSTQSPRGRTRRRARSPASVHARAASGSVSSMRPSMSKITRGGRRGDAARASDEPPARGRGSPSAQPAESLRRVRVRDRAGERVGGVRRRRARQREQPAHHLLHLLLRGLAVADDRLLHLQRRVLGDREAAPAPRPRSRRRAPARAAASIAG